MKYSKKLKQVLNKLIKDTSKIKELFTKKTKNFTRNRKLTFENIIKFSLCMNGNTIQKEIYNYFGINENVATSSAYIQQIDKILPEYYAFLFDEFTSMLEKDNTFLGYQLLAIDGTALNIAYNPNDKNTYLQTGRKDSKGHNEIHINALYDLNNKIYTDCIIQYGVGNERQALIEMIKKHHINENSIIIADRGYESYNIFAHLIENNINFVIRVKDINSNGVLKNYKNEYSEFDTTITKLLTRKQTKESKSKDVTYLMNNSHFDFVDENNPYYTMNLRIIRFKLPSGKYECLVTNLDEKKFSTSIIKNLYQLRWGIETSFRELKYSIGLVNLHSRKVETIIKEIYCRMILFNFCESVVQHISLTKETKYYKYQINKTLAIFFCKKYLKCRGEPFNLEKMTIKNLLPIKEGKHNERIIKPQKAVSFMYRIA